MDSSTRFLLRLEPEEAEGSEESDLKSLLQSLNVTRPSGGMRNRRALKSFREYTFSVWMRC